MRPFAKPEVAAVFGAYPAEVRRKLGAIRELIFDTAARTPGVGLIDETLKWGQPAYLTPESMAGSTFRIDAIRSQPRLRGLFSLPDDARRNVQASIRRHVPL